MVRARNLGKALAKPFIGLGVRTLVSIAYEFALASLVPLSILLLTPGFQVSWSYVKAASAALGVMIGGFVMLLVYKKKLDSALMSLGLMTLVPGLLAIVVTWWNPETLFTIAGQYFVGFEHIEPLFQDYIKHAVPQVNLVGLIYTLIGVSLLAAGVHLRFLKKKPSANP